MTTTTAGFEITGSNTPASNRARVADHKNIAGYIEQEYLVRHWYQGYMPPKGLVLGELPIIPKGNGRAPERHTNEWFTDNENNGREE